MRPDRRAGSGGISNSGGVGCLALPRLRFFADSMPSLTVIRSLITGPSSSSSLSASVALVFPFPFVDRPPLRPRFGLTGEGEGVRMRFCGIALLGSGDGEGWWVMSGITRREVRRGRSIVWIVRGEVFDEKA